jgi:glycosyltransferase involved in cell wall biosynthesis
VVASHRVPFATEYLLGKHVETVAVPGSDHPLRLGEGGIVVQADDVAGFATALTRLLTNQALSRKIGNRALEITAPYFTWSKQVPAFMKAIKSVD